MGEIKDYHKEKKALLKRRTGSTENQEGETRKTSMDSEKAIREHHRKQFYSGLLLLAALLGVALLVYVQFKRHIYTDYDITATVERELSVNAKDLRFNDAVLTYSKDGAHCTTSKGVVNWNQTFEIQDLLVSISGNVVAMGDYRGRTIMVQNTEKQLNEISTNKPILNLAVAANGYVTAILDGGNSTVMKTYDSEGKEKIEGERNMAGSGYPAAISLSPEAELLAVTYWYVDTGVLKSNVEFYNLGSVGENYNDLSVSGYSYTDTLIPSIQFINDSTAFAVADNRLILYSGRHIPVETLQQFYDEEVQSVFYDDRYIGLVFRTDDAEIPYRLDIFDSSVKNPDNFFMGSYPIDIDYTDIFFGEDNFVVYNEKQCVITTFKKVEKFRGEFNKSVRLMLPEGNRYRYTLVTDKSIDTIQLR